MHEHYPLSQNLQSVKQEVDELLRNNPLFLEPFAEATWSFLTYCEDLNISTFKLTRNVHEQRAIGDNLVNVPKNPIRWLFQHCPPGGSIPNLRHRSAVAAEELFHLASIQQDFETVYEYANMGLLDLSIHRNRIQTSGTMRDDAKSTAYDRLVAHYQDKVDDISDKALEYINSIRRNTSISEDWFDYPLNPRVVRDGIQHIGSIVRDTSLPLDTQLHGYSVEEFLKVGDVILTMALIHFYARLHSVVHGCIGNARSIFTMQRNEFYSRVQRYCGISNDKVSTIIEDLTFGSRGQLHPDIALQPIIPICEGVLALSPSILMYSAIERNVYVLHNRIPEAQRAYSIANRARETTSRERIMDDLSELPLDFWHGRISSWKESSDIDLIIISHKEQCCLILELKSFVGPAEPREIANRSNDIKRGIQQITSRKQRFLTNMESLFTIISIDRNYHISWAVASETSIGISSIQSDCIPVVNVNHLIARILSEQSLLKCCEWLDHHEHLPIEGIHYRVVETETTLGDWTLEWYGIECLVDNYL